MLWHILDAHGGLPRDAFVVFANTGRERDETLDFVHEVETRWAVPIRWLEYDGKDESGDGTWKEVDYATAHRRHEPDRPFDKMLREMPCLPNPLVRRCTGELKQRTIRRFLESRGWDSDFHRFHAIGIRADEVERTFQIIADCPAYVRPQFPMVPKGVTVAAVMKFWRKQDFDLQLDQHQGNCDLCFLKARWKQVRAIREDRESARWWLEWEKAKEATADSGSKFRSDRTVSEMFEEARQGVMEFEEDEEDIPCGCGFAPGDWAVFNEEPTP
jgi:hypothetical protein